MLVPFEKLFFWYKTTRQNGIKPLDRNVCGCVFWCCFWFCCIVGFWSVFSVLFGIVFWGCFAECFVVVPFFFAGGG